MRLKKIIYKGLLNVSLALFVAAIFLPWLWERGRGLLAIYPPITTFSQFWSYQAVINVFYGTRLVDSFILRFQEYWFSLEFGYPNVFQGWMVLLVFQILAVAFGTLSIFKENEKRHPLPLIGALSTSAVTLILGYYQFLRHSVESGRGFYFFAVSLDIGFLLAVLSVILWLISLLIRVHNSKESMRRNSREEGKRGSSHFSSVRN